MSALTEWTNFMPLISEEMDGKAAEKLTADMIVCTYELSKAFPSIIPSLMVVDNKALVMNDHCKHIG
jgi:hypothetical protein